MIAKSELQSTDAYTKNLPQRKERNTPKKLNDALISEQKRAGEPL